MAYQTVKGTYDLLAEDVIKFNELENLFRQFLSLYGYSEIKTPVFEYTGVFKKENDTSDMVTKEMYTFSPNEKDSLTLRPEGTAGVIRSFVEHKMYGNAELPVKLAYIEEMFRHERPQKGRQRQFTQMGIECIGEKNPLIDAEVIALGYFYVKALGLESIKVLINTLGDNESRLNYKNDLINYFKPHKDELCFDCQNRLEKNPLRILDCKVDHELDIIKNAPKMKLTESASNYFEQVKKYLDVLQIPYEVDDRLVRGLDYYTDHFLTKESSLEQENGSIGNSGHFGLNYIVNIPVDNPFGQPKNVKLKLTGRGGLYSGAIKINGQVHLIPTLKPGTEYIELPGYTINESHETITLELMHSGGSNLPLAIYIETE